MASNDIKINDQAAQNEIVLEENEMICTLTNRKVKSTDKELTLQSMIEMMAEEYGFATEDMERDYKVNAARKSKVDDNTARMQSIKQLGV